MKKSSKRRGPEPEQVQSANLTLRIPITLMTRMQEAARLEGMSLGSLVRQTLGIYFASPTKRP